VWKWQDRIVERTTSLNRLPCFFMEEQEEV